MFDDQIEQFAGARICPMQILKNHQHRLPLRQTSEPVQ
jgi:hypothetical protein